MNIKKTFLAALACFCTLSFSSFAQSDNSSSSDADEAKEPNSGVAIVACSAGGASIPSTVYYQNSKKEFVKFSIPARRPSKRIAFPREGVLKFWLTDPTGADFDSGSTKTSGKVVIPEPYMTVAVPSGSSGKMVCLLQAQEDGPDKLKTAGTFLPESSFPTTGQVVLNLSPYTLVLATSKKGDYTDKQQWKIAPCANIKRIESSNICPFPGDPGTRVNYVLQAQLPGIEGLSRIRATAMNISKSQSQVMIVLKDPQKAGDVITETVQVRTATAKRRTTSSRR